MRRKKTSGGASGSPGKAAEGLSPLDDLGPQTASSERAPTLPVEEMLDEGSQLATNPESLAPTLKDSTADKLVPPSAKGKNQSATKSGAWGDLPKHAQRVFRAEGGEALPPQYRAWIDAFYNKLNTNGQ